MARLDQITQSTARPSVLSLIAARDPALGSSKTRGFALLYLLEAIMDGMTVIDMTITNPSALTPSDGDRYVVAASATGAWASQDGKIATYDGSSWVFSSPSEGWSVYSTAQNLVYRYDGSAWSEFVSASQVSFNNATSGLTADDMQGVVDEIWLNGLRLPTYTVLGLPAAADHARVVVYCSDETGGAVPVFSDGTNWRRVTDRVVAS